MLSDDKLREAFNGDEPKELLFLRYPIEGTDKYQVHLFLTSPELAEEVITNVHMGIISPQDAITDLENRDEAELILAEQMTNDEFSYLVMIAKLAQQQHSAEQNVGFENDLGQQSENMPIMVFEPDKNDMSVKAYLFELTPEAVQDFQAMANSGALTDDDVVPYLKNLDGAELIEEEENLPNDPGVLNTVATQMVERYQERDALPSMPEPEEDGSYTFDL